jgi:hypothetical protein
MIMNIDEYDLGRRNIHHHPTIKTTNIEIIGERPTLVRSDIGPINNGFETEFNLGSETDFEYARQGDEGDIMTQAMVDMIIEASLEAGIEFPKIKGLIEAMSNKVTGGTDKEGELAPESNFTVYPPDMCVKEGLKRGLTLGQIIQAYKEVVNNLKEGKKKLKSDEFEKEVCGRDMMDCESETGCIACGDNPDNEKEDKKDTKSKKEGTEKVDGGYENIGKEGKHSKKPMTKKDADDQRKAMFANGYKGK